MNIELLKDEHRTSNVQHRTLKRRTSNIERPTSNVEPKKMKWQTYESDIVINILEKSKL